jgi:Peptidase family M23
MQVAHSKNLVVLRHANNYVTVYAHAKELKVKRGDQIKRGDLIGTSGQSGNVSTPQVYFEVRKYSRPVDPLPLLKDSSERHVAERVASAIWPRASRVGSSEKMATACAVSGAHQSSGLQDARIPLQRRGQDERCRAPG